MIWLIPIYKHISLDKHKLFTEVFGPLPKYLPKYFKKIETRRPYSPKGLRPFFGLAYRTLTELAKIRRAYGPKGLEGVLPKYFDFPKN